MATVVLTYIDLAIKSFTSILLSFLANSGCTNKPLGLVIYFGDDLKLFRFVALRNTGLSETASTGLSSLKSSCGRIMRRHAASLPFKKHLRRAFSATPNSCLYICPVSVLASLLLLLPVIASVRFICEI